MEAPKITRGKVVSGLVWRFAERIGAQLVGFIISLVLARLLNPEIYGTVAIVNVFIAILNVFVTSGFGTALMQKKNADDTDFSSVFYFQMFFSIVLYILLFIFAPTIAKFYNNNEITSIIRVLGFTLVISGINNVQRAYVSKTLQFKRFFFSTLIGTVVSGVIGVTMAFIGFGVWAVVFQSMCNSAVDTIILWFTVKWRPKLIFSLHRLKGLFSFGWKLLVSSLLDTVYNNLYSLIIGKKYTAKDLGLFNKAQQFPSLIITNLNAPIQSVLLPAISAEQDDAARVKSMVRRSIKTSTYLVFPLMVGMAAVATPMINILLGEQWLECVPILQIACITMALWPIHTTNLQAINALGRSDIFLKLEIIKKIVGISAIIICIPYGVFALALGQAASGLISSFVNAFPNKKLLNYGYLEQLKDILPSVAISLVMGTIVLLVEILNLNIYLTLIIQILTGVLVYLLLSKLFKLEAFTYLFDMIKTKVKRK